MIESLDQKFVDALDIVAIRNGDKRLTRQQTEDLKAATALSKKNNDRVGTLRLQLPTDEAFIAAKALLPRGIRALMVMNRVVHGSFPAKRLEESDKECRERLQHEGQTREDDWRKAIVSRGVFPVPTWVTSAIAQTEGFRNAPGDLTDQPRIERAQRVHVEGWCVDQNGPKFCVLYPRAIVRGVKGPLELGQREFISLETVRLSKWIVSDGWVSGPKRSPPRAQTSDAATDGAGTAGPVLIPSWG